MAQAKTYTCIVPFCGKTAEKRATIAKHVLSKHRKWLLKNLKAVPAEKAKAK